MKVYSAVIERCPQTGLFVGFVPGFPGAHSQGETLDEVNHNLHDVITMLLEDGELSTVMDRDGKSRVFDQIACWEGENPPQGT